ncbi:GNAT family N-acetyltransferase [Glycomyces sp. TRM65418]|uniref:GNAT family N-acetyltransferase n=1 Tax=Glycomyces sp. TRM65418 TaxID=2867006 RepID=UPI001CE52B5C|nr:GNAT family N-acetyltransferase [Glycomyces sp. TRM65418]MCC3764188.1 GNAT family N-acetyltransferase [Glycomyces sp. TRM65418]QZD53872.1 GNAT family N-acetyltransferase [Glycomyces sp. TRM65418]
MRIRTGGPADADEIVQVRSASWRAAYRGILSDEALAQLPEVASEQFVRDLARRHEYAITFVAEKGPNVIGFATACWDTRESSAEEAGPGTPGEVRALYVHPDHWGRRAGYALMRECHRWLAGRGMLPVRVWTLAGNDLGRGFYERYGFVPDGERDTLEISGEAHAIERLSLPEGQQADELT